MFRLQVTTAPGRTKVCLNIRCETVVKTISYIDCSTELPSISIRLK